MKYIKTVLLSLLLCFGLDPICASVAQTQDLVQVLKNKKAKNIKLFPTEALYIKYAMHRSSVWSNYQTSCDWSSLISKISKIEALMANKGYVTFVHAHKWEWHFLNDVWNLVCSVRDNQTTMYTNISLRQRDKNCDVKKLYDLRLDLLKSGASSWGSGFLYANKSAELIFMNRTFLSSVSGGGGECSGCYFLENVDQSPYNKALEIAIDLLKKYGLEAYAGAINDLFALHQSCSSYGELLCISIKKDEVNKCVYAARPGGEKDIRYSNTYQKVIHDEVQVNKDKSYFDDGTKSGLEIYCLAVSDIPGEYGVKYTINSVNLADQAKLKAYKSKLNALFLKIKKDKLIA